MQKRRRDECDFRPNIASALRNGNPKKSCRIDCCDSFTMESCSQDELTPGARICRCQNGIYSAYSFPVRRQWTIRPASHTIIITQPAAQARGTASNFRVSMSRKVKTARVNIWA